VNGERIVDGLAADGGVLALGDRSRPFQRIGHGRSDVVVAAGVVDALMLSGQAGSNRRKIEP